MKDIMIDIETYATRNDAAIVQIGAVNFDGSTGEVGETFLVSVDRDFYEGCTDFHVDERTVQWWGRQSLDARKSLEINKVQTPYLAMDRLVKFFEDVGFKKSRKRKDGLVWANPPQFDLSILRYCASKAYGSDNDVPWHYRQESDMRTLCSLAKSSPYDVDPETADRLAGLVAHRADHDAIRQAIVVSRMLKEIRS